MIDCEWCIDGKCRSGNEDDCDFKNLPMTEKDIKSRIEFEVDQIEAKLKDVKAVKEETEIITLINQMKDKVEGIKVMQDVLEQKFGVRRARTIKNPFRFMKMVIDVNKYMKKLRQEKEKEGIKDGSGSKG